MICVNKSVSESEIIQLMEEVTGKEIGTETGIITGIITTGAIPGIAITIEDTTAVHPTTGITETGVYCVCCNVKN